ncbi:TPA: hypothetical protein OMS40_003948 [Klebsiella aerogenes]|uniref:hypothetical protein n=1 Tax=Klebsiella aerogenes TaxID=548 RepID=UPI002FF20033|nr:hypothetical protein [Klebsiella aerogenes]
MTKSTITRERAEQLANFKGAPVTRQEEQELARIALAAMDSEPVGSNYRKLFTCTGCGAEGLDEPLETNCHCCVDGAHWIESRLYRHAQPAPEKYNIGDATMRHIFTPTGMTNISDLQAVFDRVEVVLSSMESEHVVTITDAMAYAFHHALTDGPLGDDDVEDIKTGLRAAFATVTIKQPEPVVPVEATIDNKPNSSYEWRKGWNACLAAMLAVAPPAPKSTVK